MADSLGRRRSLLWTSIAQGLAMFYIGINQAVHPNDSTLPQLSTNQTWQLSKEAAGRAVMLTFWTSWCPDSERDLAAKMPLAAHADQNKLPDVHQLAVGCGGWSQNGPAVVGQWPDVEA